MEDSPSNVVPNTEMPPITNASLPFNHTDADVILRSSNYVDFKVFKLLLSMTSPFFKDMFSLPQEAVAFCQDNNLKDGLPVIQVSEEAKILRVLLSLCYPTGVVDVPILDNLKDIDLLLDTSIKYSFGQVESCLRAALVAPEFLQNNALSVYAIANRHKLDEEAIQAARALTNLSAPILQSNCGSELEYLSAAHLLQLLQYHKICCAAAETSLKATYSSDGHGISEYLAIQRYCTYCESTQAFTLDWVLVSDTIFENFKSGLPPKAAVMKLLEDSGSFFLACNSCYTQQTSEHLTLCFVNYLFLQRESAICLVSSLFKYLQGGPTYERHVTGGPF